MDYDDVDDDDENACNQEFASKCKYGTEYLDWLRHQLLYKEVAYSMRFCSSFYFSFLLFFFLGGGRGDKKPCKFLEKRNGCKKRSFT